MAKGFDISILGDRALQRKLNQLERKEARKIVSRALRNSAKRVRPEVANRAPVDTGTLRDAMSRAKIRVQKSNVRGGVRLGIVMPSREDLGIAPDDKGYYPFSLEYGQENAAARPYIRPTVDRMTPSEHRKIGRDIGKAIERRAKV